MERELILSKLTMEQVLQFYTPRKVTRHRCACPIHNGTDNNFTIYNDSFYCWVCGAAGDFIKFVSLLFNLTYPDAMKKIDTDFALGVYKKPTLTQYRTNKRLVKNWQAKKRLEQRQQEKHFAEYRKYTYEWQYYTDCLKTYKPKSADEEIHPLFIEALKKLPYIEHWLDTYDWRWEGE